MKLLLLLLKHSRGTLFLAISAAALSGAANTAALGVLNRSINSAGGEVTSLLTWVFFGLCVLVPLVRIGAEVLLIRLGQNTVFKMRMDFSVRVLGVALRRLEIVGPHRILSTLTEDIPRITAVVTLLPVLCFNAAIVVSCFVYLIVLSPTAFLASSGLVVIGVLCYQLPVIKANQLFQAVRRLNDDLYDHFDALIRGMKELKLHRRRREAFIYESLQGTALEFKQRDSKALTIYTMASSWGQLMIFFTLGFLVFVVPSMTEISKATLSGYALVFIYMTTPLQMMMNSMPALNRANVSVKRIDDLGLDLENDHEDLPLAEESAPTWERLELDGVAHVYHLEGEERDFTLGPVDLEFRRGELVFIIGGNGSGKTTLAKVLSGLYVPDAGEIRLDGRPVDGRTRGAYRELFTVIFSDFFLFEELLGLDDPEIDAKAKRYLTQLKLDSIIEITDGVLSTTQLSQGQRKRLALLTAYLEDRPIYLFDEWAADQDPFFKKIFYHQLLPELKGRGKTIFVISHDDAYYDVADRVIKLDYGQVTSDVKVTDGVDSRDECRCEVST